MTADRSPLRRKKRHLPRPLTPAQILDLAVQLSRFGHHGVEAILEFFFLLPFQGEGSGEFDLPDLLLLREGKGGVMVVGEVEVG